MTQGRNNHRQKVLEQNEPKLMARAVLLALEIVLLL